MAFDTTGFILRPPRIASGNARSTGEASTGVSRDHKDLPGSFDGAAAFVEAHADQYRAAVLDNPNGTGDEYLVWAANTGSLSLLPGESYAIDGDTVEPATFWWTRNDRRFTRFGWNGTSQRWEPFKGSSPQDLGTLTEPAEFQLTPRPSRFVVGQTLPRGGGDAYAILRAGIRPDNSSVQLVVIVVNDGDIDASLVDFGALGDPDAVIEQTSGRLLMNPASAVFEPLFGLNLWYIPEDFADTNTGNVGLLLGSDVTPRFIAPIPGPTDYPFIRIGSRRHLTAIPVEFDSDLDAAVVGSGEVAWAQTTGRLKFNQTDIDRADPDSVSFDASYIEEAIFYDGYAMSTRPVPLPEAVQLVDGVGTPAAITLGGDLYVPLAAPLEAPGTSGILHVPDGTGTVPNASVTPGTRPNGSGLVREVQGDGDIVVFTSNGVIGDGRVFAKVEVVEFEDDLPALAFKVPEDTIYIAKQAGAGGSKVQFRRAGITGHDLYFRQATVTPSTVVATDGLDARLDDTPRIYSREIGLFAPDKTELLPFYIDGVGYVWDASTLPAPSITPSPGDPDAYTADEIAASIDAILPGGGVACRAVRDHVVLYGTTSVEIGLGVNGASPSGALDDRDTSGQALLGFLPGWRVEAGRTNWLPDNGASLGVFRSPLNKDRSMDTPDVKAFGRLNEAIITENVGASPLFILPAAPLRDIPGVGADQFFRVVSGQSIRTLDNLSDVIYDFANTRFGWAQTSRVTAAIENQTANLPLGNPSIVPYTMDSRVVPGNGLSVSPDGLAWASLTRDVEYLTPAGGTQGLATVITRVGGIKGSGTRATALTATRFTDGDTPFDFTTATEGYVLQVLSGPNLGFYTVTSVVDADTINVTPEFPDPSVVGMVWEVFEGYPTTDMNEAILADVQYAQFNHLPEETFKVRLLSSTGTAGGGLTAIVTEALQHGRDIGLRFGQAAGSPSATLTVLSRGILLGQLANDSLSIPYTLSDHFTTGRFEIRVGAQSYTPTLAVWVDGDTPPAGNVVEYRADGALRFGDAVFTSFRGSSVFYDEIALLPGSLAAGSAEVDPNTGVVTISTADATAYSGTTVYLVERLISENRQDVFLSPLSGSFYMNRPLREGQLVEAEYYKADSNGNRIGDVIIEFLPVLVRLEEATRVGPTVYEVNAAGRTIAPIDAQIWVDGELQNWGNVTSATFVDGTVTFALAQDVAAVVKVNYAVYEATGGEQAYNTSTTPVWRPPFYVDKGQDTFVLDTDRTYDVVPGKLMRLGASTFYVKSATYDATADTTSVVLYPTPTAAAGSKAPGKDVLTLISSEPVALTVDGVVTGGNAGFLPIIPATYEAVSKGSPSVIFHGDLTAVAIPGFVLEMGGDPYIVVGRELADDGRTTQVELAQAAIRSYVSGTDAVRLSMRPIYPPNPTTFLGRGPFLDTEPFELIRMGDIGLSGEEPGRALVRDIDYVVDTSSGGVTLLPWHGPLAPWQKLVFHHTRVNELGPKVQDGALIAPRFQAQYAHLVRPTADNGYLGTTLTATYTFRAPDSFYFRVVPLAEYTGEVNEILIKRLQSRNPQGGAPLSAPGAVVNHEQGTFGLMGQLRDLFDQDRAARAFITFYNAVIVAFEQCSETISGGVVGDRDGKFRFFIGQGKRYAPPGYEDEITGYLTPRNVWREVFFAANKVFTVTEDDPIVDPVGSERLDTGAVEGKQMNPFYQDFYIEKQGKLVRNDMDDIVLAGLSRPTLQLVPGLVLPRFRTMGVFKAMWEAHRLSRLFPERALAFTTLYPGLNTDPETGDPGAFAFFRFLDPPASEDEGDGKIVGSTYNKPVGVIANPAFGTISNMTDAVPRERLPRARVWAYYPNGSTDLDAALGTTTDGFATIVATPMTLAEFPIDPSTGFPDITQLSSSSPPGLLPDLTTGDPVLSTPPWLPLDAAVRRTPAVAVGRPSGSTYTLGDNTNRFTQPGADAPNYGGVFVQDVQAGCVIILGDKNGNPLAGDDVLRLVSGLAGQPLTLNRGDTVFITPATSKDANDFSDPPTAEEMEEYTKSLPVYRRGFDIAMRKRGESFVDISFPSIKDPFFPIKEILGQRSPEPFSTIEADVEFVNTERDPFEFPALQGQPYNDDGDYTIPYLGVTNTEINRLGAASSTLLRLILTDNFAGTGAVWPDEIRGSDGAINQTVSVSGPPSTLLTGSDLSPTNGAFVSGSGLADLRAFDLVLVERGQAAIPVGSQGIIHVGALDTTQGHIEPPRFVTSTVEGDLIKYTLEHAMTGIGGGGVSGMVVTDSPSGLDRQINFDITSMGGSPFFSDGAGSAAGGLNNVVGANNVITIRLFNPGTGALLETISITFGGNVVAGGGSGGLIANFINDTTIGITVPSSIVTNVGGPFDFTVSVDTYNGGTGAGSTTAWVDADRLTFNERMDLSTMLERGTVTAGAVSVAAGLSVFEVTTGVTSGVTVNAPVEVNAGSPFTMLSRTVGSSIVGTGVAASGAGAGDEIGTTKVMGWEGHGNVSFPTDLSGITFAAMPSSSSSASAALPSGTGTFDAAQRNILRTTVGVTADIRAGDLLTVAAATSGSGAVTAGTYLVRHVVPGSGAVSWTALAGTEGWATIRFPRIVAYDEGALTLTIDDVGDGPSGMAWAASGRVYVGIESDPASAVSMAYTLSGAVFTLASGSGLDATLGGISDADFFAKVVTNGRVSGMAYMKIGNFPGLPTNNVAGLDGTGVGGFTHVSVAKASSVAFVPVAVPAMDEIGVTVASVASPTVFDGDPETVVYDNVPLWLDLSQISGTVWDTIHTAAAATTTGVACVLPGDLFVTNSVLDADGLPTGAAGFTPAYGIYVEPSFPRSCRPLYAAVPPTRPLVVDAASSGATEPSPDDVGVRDPTAFGAPATEAVVWDTRRVRRWSEALVESGVEFGGLRFVYEVRRGTVSTYSGRTLTADTSGGDATQLGPFNDPAVNINPGDEVRLLDGSGTVVDIAEVGAVRSSQLILREPGFTVTVNPGDTFEVYLKQAPVPLEQSHEELLDALTSEVVFSQTGTPNSAGGRVATANELRDLDAGIDFLNGLGVQQGDIVVVDPAGMLEGPGGPASPVEFGARPFGDRSVPGRANHAIFPPDELDDNRGFYRVASVAADALTINPVTYFSGPAGSPVVYGSTTPTNRQYAVLPVVSAGVGGAPEGQMDLRVTAPADGANSYAGNLFSVEAFSYRIIRPDTRFSDDTVDLVLFMRERLLSWMEELGDAIYGWKFGSYHVFQRDEHITDVGTGAAVLDGLGVPSNDYILGLIGNVTYAPFENVTDCLSILDRRFWILDLRLDAETPPGGGSVYAVLGTGEGRPVLPDLLDEPVTIRDRFRTLRYAWLRFRADRVEGTLPAATRFEAELPRRQREQEEYLLLQAGLDDA